MELMKQPFFVSVFVALMLAVVGTGCVGFVVGAGVAAGGTVAYVMGELKSEEPHDFRATWNATEHAVKDLKYFVIETHHDDISGKFILRNSYDQKIQIVVDSMNMNLTEVRIRVGVFGDQTLSRLVLEKIHSHL